MHQTGPPYVKKRHRGPLFDHLVGDREQARRQGEAKLLGRLEIDDELEFARSDHGQVAWFFTPENADDIIGAWR
jgi:hypothetical protein